jgi:hypothetical protein
MSADSTPVGGVLDLLAPVDGICQTAASMADRHDSALCLAGLRAALSYDAFGYAYPFAWRFS